MGAAARYLQRCVLCLAVALAGCPPPLDSDLPVPLPLSAASGGDILYAYGTSQPTEDPDCTAAPLLGSDQAAPRRLIFDTGTPLSSFRNPAASLPLQRFADGQILLRRADRTPAGLLCDVPLVAVGPTVPDWVLQWGNARTDVQVVVGGDILGRYATSLSFSNPPDPTDPLCRTPPCLRLLPTSIANQCTLSLRGEAVFSAPPQGGNTISVEAGDSVFLYPSTRVTLSACVEPLADPLPKQMACLRQDALTQVTSVPADLKAEWDLVVKDATYPGPGFAGQCRDASQFNITPQLEQFIEDNRLRDAHYDPSGTNMRLLVSTALPGFLLSRTAYLQLRPNDTALFNSGPQVAIQVPGFAQETAYRTQLGNEQLGVSALALVNRERQLSPCAELARSRRQRYAFPDLGHYQKVACLQNLERDPSQRDRRCGYSGPSTQLACDDHLSPVASVIEIGPQLEVLVVDDSSALLQSVNADLLTSTPQVDGIIGVSVLSQLQTEIDYPAKRVVAHCRCDSPGPWCRTYPRVTYFDADDCGDRGQPLCIAGRLTDVCTAR